MEMRNVNKKISAVIRLVLTVVLAISLTACSGSSVRADDLMEGISPGEVAGKETDAGFTGSMADFSVKLFKKTITEDENSLISPLSVMIALAMTANGADTQTLEEMEKLLGGDIGIDELNEYLYTYYNGLPSEKKSKLSIANSIWFRDVERLTVEKEFLQTNADYYGAEIYRSAFDAQAIKDINGWVDQKTEGMIDRIIDEIDQDTVMYLINAIVFDAEWEKIYVKDNIRSGEFMAVDGTSQNVDFMWSEESLYIDDGMATGFIKPYADGNYSFVALLPNEETGIDGYIENLTGEGLMETIADAQTTKVNAGMPKFSYAYEIEMNDALKALGMPTAFSPSDADLSRLGSSTAGNLYISDVLHKTFISVDEKGTKAGAVTKVEIKEESAEVMEQVILDRPFVYAIVDHATGLPVFMGTVMSVE